MARFRDPSLKSRPRGSVSGIDPRIRGRDSQFQGSIPEIKAKGGSFRDRSPNQEQRWPVSGIHP